MEGKIKDLVDKRNDQGKNVEALKNVIAINTTILLYIALSY